MSRIYETLRRIESEKRGSSRNSSSDRALNLDRIPDQDLGSAPLDSTRPLDVLDIRDTSDLHDSVGLSAGMSARIDAREDSRLVALTEPKSLGAEKFRSLVARLENLRRRRELKSLQITSAVVNEGKSLIAANLALTLVRHFNYKVLLVEGDLHRPALGSLLGLSQLDGIGQWWQWQGENEPGQSGEGRNRRQDRDGIDRYLAKLEDLPLWFLSAGSLYEQPAQILQSDRFGKMFEQMVSTFDWVVVDSPPMSAVVDVDLWSRLVDGALLVVREGVAPIKALEAGIKGLDNPKWLGIALNEASEFERVGYGGLYYGATSK